MQEDAERLRLVRFERLFLVWVGGASGVDDRVDPWMSCLYSRSSTKMSLIIRARSHRIRKANGSRFPNDRGIFSTQPKLRDEWL